MSDELGIILIELCMLLYGLFSLAFLGVILYMIIHFAIKYW